MRVTRVTCDRCKRLIDTEMSMLVIESRGQMAKVIDKADLCGPCGQALLEWLRDTPEPFHPD